MIYPIAEQSSYFLVAFNIQGDVEIVRAKPSLQRGRIHEFKKKTYIEDISSIQVSSLKNPYKYISWLFAQIVGQDST